ncbi:glycosyltransferase family 90 protein [Trichoderma longibrachiatum ATCC 18648]|uniref:Glycosyltransferase family 90 protein n=1 Tax=Trichoderma longibrachiatum ATCC 18648 TaxID=983965 RepID=A0A2T4BTR8_TRILO|nr:glycosyltransferase family 90 protein [Trichoderma longibrachiatum ATCC 18648]
MRGVAYYPLALICLSFSSYLLSARYYTSASFERPVHFTIVTLLFTACSLLASEHYWSRQSGHQSLAVIANHKTPIDIISPTSTVVKYTRIGLELIRHVHPSFPFLLCCIGLRALFYWAIIRTTQCSRPGIEAFLPFFSFIWETIWPQLFKKQFPWSMPSTSQIIFIFLAAAWPLFIISAEESSNIPTGTVCPIGWRWEHFVPLIQLINCFLDAVIISHTAHLSRTAADEGVDISSFIGKLCLAAAGTILLLSFPSWLSDSEFILAFRFRAVDYRDFALDGFLATAGLLSSLTLLPSLDPSCLALLIITASFAGLRIPVLKDDQMEWFRSKGQQERAKVTTSKDQKTWPNSSFSQVPWPEDFAEPIPRGTNGGKDEIDPNFTNDIRTPIFYDFVAASCPPDSAARNIRWWDWGSTCVNCLKPHSVPTTGGALLANVSLSHDLCHQPDAAYLSGFLSSPSAMVRTSELLPIFSQARVGGFSDILIPSPWNFDEKSAFKEDSGVDWEDKENALFWRGSRSDGFSAHGRWQGFLRPRFVHEAYEKTVALRRTGAEHAKVDVSFTGEISKCDGRNCAAESETYKKWGRASMANDSTSHGADELPPSVPFEEHWRYRHLFDMDGAGFSGRFLPFLESRSVPYRAAFFRTWYDERLQPWLHYVPVDFRLGSGFWSVLEFLIGSADDKDGEGPAMARKIAEQGREWAQRALRKEDMQVYMFRLLLEWGRITHDEREHLGFTISM